MGFNNPQVPWSELEKQLSGRLPPRPARPVGDWANGGDAPAWSHHRPTYQPPADLRRPTGSVPYAELHSHSNFSFLDGASHPEELAEEAARLGLEALALTDHDGFYGVVRFAEAASTVGLPTVFGAELTIAGRPDRGSGATSHIVVLARDPAGYAALGRTISRAQLAGEKGAPRLTADQLAEEAAAAEGHWLALTGCRQGAVPAALVAQGPAAAGRELARLVACFGRGNVAVELWDHGDPLDTARNDALAQVALRAGVDLLATNNVHYATPSRRRLATALAAVAARTSLDEVQGRLPAGAGAHLRSGTEQARRFARWPGVVERAAEVGRACAFDLRLVAPNLPPFPCPPGHDEMSYLRQLVEQGASRPTRYGTRADPRPLTGPDGRPCDAWAQLDHELDLIERLGFPGYFLIVWDIVRFCREANILCQGRGSAANSAACYALDITKADAVALGLLFERFLSPERDGPPDIDLDIESGRREEVIQYVYGRYGRQAAAQVANVITYRARSSVRDMAKALGFATGQQDAWSKQLDAWSGLKSQAQELEQQHQTQALDHDGPARRNSCAEPREEGGVGAPPGGAERPASNAIPSAVLELATELEHFPRHLGIHSGGMVLCDRPVVEVCPVEWARMADRSVLQWDKDDCAAVGLVKFDLLGLGMLSALHGVIDLVAGYRGEVIDIADLPQDPEVYAMLCRADSVGVFQVESRAQMATLPRLRPRTFYDLVVEVALIRPGPIQGGSVHPFIRRRNGQEEVTYPHPLTERALRKTLGVPLFQEQLMQLAIDVAGFTPSEADQLRQAMGSKRSRERMERLRQRLFDGMAERGVTGEVAVELYEKLAAFANYGFPESHSVSFAYLVYASSWFKRYEPAAFCAALLNAQPMGFYSPHSLVQDARRHGVNVFTPDVNRSAAKATLVGPARSGQVRRARPGEAQVMRRAREEGGVGAPPGGAERPGARPGEAQVMRRAREEGGVGAPPGGAERPEQWGARGPAVRLGIGSVRGVGEELAERIADGRPYSSMEDLARRTGAGLEVLEALATAGAFGSLGLDRRQALWAAGAVSQSGPGRLAGVVTGATAPQLPGMADWEEANADLWATGVSPDGHPTRFVRAELERLGVVTAVELATAPTDRKVLVGGVVTHRQRPATAGGTLFINLEDETGLINVVCSKGCWARHRVVARTAPALLVRGRLERSEGVVNVIAERLQALPVTSLTRSRDFR